MQLVLNVSDDLFNDTIKDQIKSLKPEDLQEALVGAIGTYFTENKQALERVFFDRSGYGSSDQPSDVIGVTSGNVANSVCRKLKIHDAVDDIHALVVDVGNNIIQLQISGRIDLLQHDDIVGIELIVIAGKIVVINVLFAHRAGRYRDHAASADHCHTVCHLAVNRKDHNGNEQQQKENGDRLFDKTKDLAIALFAVDV